jgi:two-component system C4-dicarboxylate transport sensor histidine kinase DctB
MDLTVLVDHTTIELQAAERAGMAAILILLAAVSVRIINHRRLTVQERLSARKALQDAYDHLKRRFEERNRQLKVTNEELRKEVSDRIVAARKLQSFQDELIRAENLAVIGQLSAGLAHEINQPLAALSTLSENAVRFLELNDTGTVKYNLQRICDLVQRMGVLTGQLRSFARRTEGEIEPVNLELSVESAIALLGHRIKQENVLIDVRKPQSTVEALAEGVRLEQVLVNLISNAMDACSGHGQPRIEISFTRDGERAIMEVADNGCGLTADVQEKLFEPFFTTKKSSGLGLGLAISKDIIKGFGGELTASNGDSGGAVFRIVLPAVKTKE